MDALIEYPKQHGSVHTLNPQLVSEYLHGLYDLVIDLANGLQCFHPMELLVAL